MAALMAAESSICIKENRRRKTSGFPEKGDDFLLILTRTYVLDITNIFSQKTI
jgi:hypothetical protein